MGNGSSKKAENGLRDHKQKHKPDDTPSHPKTLKAAKKGSPKGESKDAATPKRKRKSSKHVKSAVASSSSSAEEEPRPSKRKKMNESLTDSDSIEDGRNTENVSTTVIDDSPGKAQANGSLTIEDSKDTTMQQVNVKKGKRNQAGKGHTGFFSANEVQALENFKLEFCNSHGLAGQAFDVMVQHSERHKGNDFPCDASIITKPEFWKTIYEILPDRDRRSVYRFMRRHFQDSDVKPHHWTHEQDEELIQLVGQHGLKFAQIAKELGRSDDDVVQRWKNRLEHRTTMNRGIWAEEEIRLLQNALQVVWKSLKAKGHDVGRDIYEMDETLISWGHISNAIGNCRSRQQCADKWRKARKKVQELRDKGDQDAIFDPAIEAKKTRPHSRLSTFSTWRNQQPTVKSTKYVESDDSDDPDEDEATTQDQKKGESIKTSEKESTSSDESSSDSESDSTDEPNSDNAPKDIKSKVKHNEHPPAKAQLQATESKKDTKTAPQKIKQSTSTSSTSDSEDSDSSTGADVPAQPQTSINGKSKIPPANSKNKDKSAKSSSEDDSSSSSDDESSESDGGSDQGESGATSSSGNEKAKSSKKASNSIKKQPKESSSSEDESKSDATSSSGSKKAKLTKKASNNVKKQTEESSSSSDSSTSDDSSSEDESDSESDATSSSSSKKAKLPKKASKKKRPKEPSSSESSSDSSTSEDSSSDSESESASPPSPKPKPSKSKRKKSTKEAKSSKRRRLAGSSTSTSARSSTSRDVKAEVTSD
ncbi:hypothetical protein BDV26DRAFT_63214 [Aspergillus bertholletiae]|uniref:Myb-like DNA-binding domain protein n=1 Tax=Aspergillus bertholletiae TaxID=1226010 RepID=A0A5N7AWZ9_9EURO|nr:hypothetical protein BDV26DRAFT_63214 [Aspergillus bertholletiae]